MSDRAETASRAVVIAAAKRTPIGAFQGVLSPYTAPRLGTVAAKAALAAADVKPGDIQEVIFGCVAAPYTHTSDKELLKVSR